MSVPGRATGTFAVSAGQPRYVEVGGPGDSSGTPAFNGGGAGHAGGGGARSGRLALTRPA